MKSILLISILALSSSAYASERNFDPGPFPEMLPVDGVTFWMGADTGTGESDEHPKHLVNLSPYSIGRFEITNAQYALVLNWALELDEVTNMNGKTYSEPGNVFHRGRMIKELNSDSNIQFQFGQFVPATKDGISLGNHPVESVSWYGAVAYANLLSRIQKRTPCYDKNFRLIQPIPNGYRLPSEAEWERAASWIPGTPSKKWVYASKSNELTSNQANFKFNNPLKSVGMKTYPLTSPVGYFNGISIDTIDSPSPVGCYDMSGNVHEWCQDSFSNYTSVEKTDPIISKQSEFRMVRGGGWSSVAANCRTTNRGWSNPGMVFRSFGFRVVRSR
jgi:formylglycine-generating enzyme required for sulfatase activity